LSAAVPLARIPIGVVVERRKAVSAWLDHVWCPVAVLAGQPETTPWTQLAGDADAATFYAGSTEVALYRSETANYRDNLTSGEAALWVVLRPTGVDPPFDLVLVTADPAEGEGYTQSGTDLVEPVAMPEPIRDYLAAFVAEHNVEQPFYKRQRNRADPEALGRRSHIEDDE
jgi:hypothetical protein